MPHVNIPSRMVEHTIMLDGSLSEEIYVHTHIILDTYIYMYICILISAYMHINNYVWVVYVYMYICTGVHT